MSEISAAAVVDYGPRLVESMTGNEFVKTELKEHQLASGEIIQAHYQGVGDTFIVTFTGQPYVAKMPTGFAFSRKEQSSVTEVDTALKSAVFINGEFIAGVDTSDTFRLSTNYNFTDNDPESIFEYFIQSLKNKSALAKREIEPIFEPSTGFMLEDTSVDTTENIGGLLLAKIIEHHPAFYSDLDQAKQLAVTAERLTRPKYSFKVGHHTFKVSNIYLNNGGRPSAMIYPPSYLSEGSVEPIHYYQSETHGVWRALLASGATTGTYAKGMFGDENSADAPLGTQKALSILKDFCNADQDGYGMNLLVPEIPSEQGLDISVKLMAETIMTMVILDHTGGKRIINGQRTFLKGASPESIEELFKPGSEFDFSKQLDEWEVDTKFYGRAKVRIFPSVDGKVHYALYTADTDNGFKAWVGCAEDHGAHMTKLGLLTRWVSLHKAVTETPIEHMADKYGGNIDGHDALRQDRTVFEQYVIDGLGLNLN